MCSFYRPPVTRTPTARNIFINLHGKHEAGAQQAYRLTTKCVLHKLSHPVSVRLTGDCLHNYIKRSVNYWALLISNLFTETLCK